MLLQVTGITKAQEILIYIICVLIAMVLHEAMHGYVAYWLGDTTASDQGRLTLNPLKSIDPIYTIAMPIIFIAIFKIPFIAAKPVPINFNRLKYDEFGMALVGLAGPATNFVLAIIGAILFRTIGVHGSNFLYYFLAIFTELNVAVMIFNLIPFPPLDGSRVLYAFAPDALREVMNKIESYGIVFILIIVLIIYKNPLVANVIVNPITHVTTFLLG